jgi:hypothetical protein
VYQAVSEGCSRAAQGYTCDVRDQQQVAALAGRVQRVDILVNSTATAPGSPDQVINTNLLSHFWVSRIY